ncbi:hypothetical protein BDY19DRAFT_771850 [Irpex rosettiformis]|uniref:Uncharacterized protein n=1 Tax=Irpex rosettiformis TaxID=378272 RepID=A0ACB8U8Z2_9APHY|nr:hypothetical protein BDY19DRAFT_771850 [Irpex rosettiformis]
MDDPPSLLSNTVTSGVASAIPKSLFESPGSLNRANQDSTQLFSHSDDLHTPPRMLDGHHSRQNSRSQLYQITADQPQPSPMHISLPPTRPPYAYDFSPGSPYDVYQFNPYGNSQLDGRQSETIPSQGEPSQTAPSHASEAILRDPLSLNGDVFDTLPRPSTSPSLAPTSDGSFRPKPSSFIQHGHSQSESFRAVSSSATPSQNSQPQTQATSPVPSQQSASVHSSAATSPGVTHPAHPGPITLPPPPNVSSFPIPPAHTFSPHGPYPLQTPPYPSPLHHPAVVMNMMGVNMTPHGLPPITPSMPSFTFLPQPSPTASTYEQASTTSVQGPPLPNNSSEAQQPTQGAYFPHLPPGHAAMLSPYTPFSPGVAMTPGAFWGRPGSAANPYINPAVGAPVHTSQSGYFPPVPRQPEEPQGYFPPFFGGTSSSTSKPSGLANEIELESTSGESSALGAELNYVVDAGPNSNGTTVTTLPGTEASPNPPSSSGTSWQTDSADRSPLGDVVKAMDKLGVHDVTSDPSREGLLKPRSNSAGALNGPEHPGIPRTGSDPVQKTPAFPTAS